MTIKHVILKSQLDADYWEQIPDLKHTHLSVFHAVNRILYIYRYRYLTFHCRKITGVFGIKLKCHGFSILIWNNQIFNITCTEYEHWLLNWCRTWSVGRVVWWDSYSCRLWGTGWKPAFGGGGNDDPTLARGWGDSTGIGVYVVEGANDRGDVDGFADNRDGEAPVCINKGWGLDSSELFRLPSCNDTRSGILIDMSHKTSNRSMGNSHGWNTVIPNNNQSMNLKFITD